MGHNQKGGVTMKELLHTLAALAAAGTLFVALAGLEGGGLGLASAFTMAALAAPVLAVEMYRKGLLK